MFFDSCVSPVHANILHALISPDGAVARHIRFMPDYGFYASTPGVAWIEVLGRDRPSDWVIITGDDRIRRNSVERMAWKRAGLKGFVLARAFQDIARHRIASHLLWRWPEMARFIDSAAPGSMFELRPSRGAKFVSLSV